jgi:hypothetical protein
LLCIYGDWRSNIMQTFIVSFLHLKSVMHQQNRMNEEYKIIRKKYILNNKKTVVWGFHHGIVEVAGLLDCCTMWLGNFFSTLWMNIPPLCSGLWVNSWTHNHGDERWETIIQSHGSATQKNCFLNIKTDLQLIKYFSAVSFPVGKEQPCRYTSRIFRCIILSLSRSLHKRQEA